MKTVQDIYTYVQDELQDRRKVMFNLTKSQLFFFVLATMLTAQLGFYMMSTNL